MTADEQIESMKMAVSTVEAWIARCKKAEDLLAEIVAFEKAPAIHKWAALMKRADAIVGAK